MVLEKGAWRWAEVKEKGDRQQTGVEGAAVIRVRGAVGVDPSGSSAGGEKQADSGHVWTGMGTDLLTNCVRCVCVCIREKEREKEVMKVEEQGGPVMRQQAH